MFIDYLTYYLIYLMALSFLGALIVWRFGLPSPKIVLPILAGVIFLPAAVVYFYTAYFN